MNDLLSISGVPPHPELPARTPRQQEPRRGKSSRGGQRDHNPTPAGGEGQDGGVAPSGEPEQAEKGHGTESDQPAAGSPADVGTQVDFEA